MPLRHGEDHRVFDRARVELRGADEVADVFEHDEVQVLRADLLEALLRHACIEVAHAARVELDGLDARVRDSLRVHVGVDVCLHHADAQLILERFKRAQQRHRLAAARRGHQVQQKRSVLLELRAKACGLAVVVGEDALFHLDDLIGFCHIASISFKLISLPCLSHVFSLPQCGQVRPNCTVG